MPAPPTEPQWPPRSPHEAALSTPSGRDRLRRIAEQTSPSPSPRKYARSNSVFSSGGWRQLLEPIEIRMGDDGLGSDGGDDDDEDEETLQLKLAEIQARLKLKRLQAARSRKEAGSVPGTSREDIASRSFDSATIQLPTRTETATRPATAQDIRRNVEVPVSPVRKAQAPIEQRSPVRVLLGIDKGLKAKDVSLKRAPSALRKGHDQQQMGKYLQRSRTPNPGSADSSASEIKRPLTFNERIAAAKEEEAAKMEAKNRAQTVRSEAFSLNGQAMEKYKEEAIDIPYETAKTREFSRDEIMGAKEQIEPGGVRLRRSNTVPSISSAPSFLEGDKEAASFEAYSSLHLSRRNIPHHDLVRHFSGKKVMVLEDLLRQVKSPDYSLPDIEQDIVVFAIIAKKSEPRAHKPSATKNGEERGKYMVMTLCDLQHEIELFLFNTGFERFWRLTEGTLVAILNPGIMPPPPGRLHPGRFSLTINSDDDKIIEIGTARDLGFCKSVKRDASMCGSWVNRRRTEFCEYHTNKAVKRTASARLETSSMGFGGGGGGNSHGNGRFQRTKRGEEKEGEQGGRYDRESKTHWFVSKSFSAAELIDGADRAMDRKDREEALKRKLATQEREKDIMRKLGQIGGGAGREYMIRGSASTNKPNSSTSSMAAPLAPLADAALTQLSSFSFAPSDAAARLDARSLGLVGPKGSASIVHLSPVHKRKRLDSSGGQSSASSAAGDTPSRPFGFGWGGHLRDKLTRMKDGETLRPADGQSQASSITSGDRPRMMPPGGIRGRRGSADAPARKKTRFVTDRGIKEAGRESLGVTDLGFDLGDDDELIIT